MDTSFIGGVIAASYDKLLSKSHLKSFENINRADFLNLLKTHQYGKGLDRSFDQIMIEEEMKHKVFLESIIDSNHIIFKVLYMQFDHLFLSNILKSYVLGVNYQNKIEDLSTFNETAIESYVIDGNDRQIDQTTKVLVDVLIEDTKNLDSQAISDKVVYRLHEFIIENLNPKDLDIKNYFMRHTDILNVLLLLRVNKYHLELDYLNKNLLSGGYIDKDTLIKLYQKSFDELRNYLDLHYDEVVTDTLKHEHKERFLTEFSDKLYGSLDNLLTSYSFENSGFAPVIHITLLKRAEMTHLKQLFYQIKE